MVGSEPSRRRTGGTGPGAGHPRRIRERPRCRDRASARRLRSAARYRADKGPLVAEGALLFAARRRADAAAIARRATDNEPDNLDAWFLAYSAASGERERAAAKREVARLNPWAADELP